MPVSKRPTKREGGLTIDDPRLDALRPDPAVVDEYVSRTMPNGMKDTDYLMKVWDRRENLMLVGDTQGGKTMVVNVMACLIGEKLGLGRPVPVFTLSASNGITDFDLFGQPTAFTGDDGIERIIYLPGLVDQWSDVGGILYVDEAPMMPERVTSSLHPITDWRRSFTNRNKAVQIPGDGFMAETKKVNDLGWVVGTMNAGYRGSGALNEAFANRFRHLQWDYDETVERKLIPNEGVRIFGQALRDARALGRLRTPVGTAALMRMAKDVEEDGPDMALFSLLSMYTPDERPVVQEIIEQRSFDSLIVSVPDAVSGPGWPDPNDPSPF